jgi:hypothetical protein
LNASGTAELLKLVAALREWATQWAQPSANLASARVSVGGRPVNCATTATVLAMLGTIGEDALAQLIELLDAAEVLALDLQSVPLPD